MIKTMTSVKQLQDKAEIENTGRLLMSSKRHDMGCFEANWSYLRALRFTPLSPSQSATQHRSSCAIFCNTAPYFAIALDESPATCACLSSTVGAKRVPSCVSGRHHVHVYAHGARVTDMFANVSSDYVSTVSSTTPVTFNSELDEAPLTVMFWYKRTAASMSNSDHVFVNAKQAYDGNGFQVGAYDSSGTGVDKGRVLSFSSDGAGYAYVRGIADDVYPRNEWVHVAVTFSSNDDDGPALPVMTINSLPLGNVQGA